MLAGIVLRHDPGDGWQGASFSGHQELVHILDIAELIVLLDSIKSDQGIPYADGTGAEGLGYAEHGIICAIRLAALGEVIGP